MTTEIINDDLIKNTVTATKDLNFIGFSLISPNQYRWSKKRLVEGSNCSLCPNSRSYWVYTLIAFADGCPLGEHESLDVTEDYVAEEPYDENRRKFNLTFSQEQRGDKMDVVTPQYLQENNIWVNEHGFRRIGI